MLRSMRLAGACLITAAITSCGGGGGGTPDTPTIATISLSQTSATLAPAATLQLTATPLDAGGTAITGQAFTWSTSASTVAMVSTSGLVTAVAAGTATITATSGTKSAQAVITVASSVASVTLSLTSASLVPGATTQLTATPKDAGGATVTGQTVTWSTTAASVATVNNGLVTAVAVGTATITAIVGTKSADAIITVNPGAVIGAAGGSVTSADGNATVTIPAGALSSATSISIVPTASAPTNPVAVGLGYDLLPSGTTFTSPVTIKLKYNPALVPTGHAAGALQVRTLAAGIWTAVGTPVVDSVAHTVTTTTTHFSTYISTDPRLTFGARNGDDFTAIKASSMSVDVCLFGTKRVVVLFYDPGLSGFTPSYTWGMTSWSISAGSTLTSPTVYSADVVIHGEVLGGPTDLIVTVNGESATLHITVIACISPTIVYTRDVGGSDNSYAYMNGGNTALTTTNNASKVSTRFDGLGASLVYNNGSNRTLDYTGVSWNLRANLQTPAYTTTGFIEGLSWVSPTQYEFAETTGGNNPYQMFRINNDGSGGRTPFAAAATAGGTTRGPTVAANGFTYFAFTPAPGTAPTQLYRVDANGANLTKLLTVNGWAWTPTVSPDNQWVAMSVYDAGFTVAPLQLYDLNNLAATPILVGPATGFSTFPAFCGNGVVYYSYSTNLNGPFTLYRWDMATRVSTPAAFVASGSIPEGVSVQPQKGTPDHGCPK